MTDKNEQEYERTGSILVDDGTRGNFTIDIHGNATRPISKLCIENAASTFMIEEDDSPRYRRIGDMVYFKDINKPIPIRNLPKDMRKRLKL